MAKAKTYRPKEPFRFLELPPELRNRVYSEFFIVDTECLGRGIWTMVNISGWSVEGVSMLALLETCRQIYEEAKTIPYFSNRIHFSNIGDLFKVMTDLSLDKVHAMTHISIVLHADNFKYCDDERNWSMLKFLPNLTSLRISDMDHVSENFLKEPDHAVCRAVKGLKDLKELEIVLDEYERFDKSRYSREKRKASELASVYRKAIGPGKWNADEIWPAIDESRRTELGCVATMGKATAMIFGAAFRKS